MQKIPLSSADETFRVLESAPDAMVIAGRDGNIVFANAQTEGLFGYRRDELVEKPIEILVPERFRGRHVAHRTGYFAEPRARPMGAGLELFGRRKNGAEFPVEISLSPIETERGLLIASAIRDITERKRVERMLQEKNLELEHANAAKDHFLAGMSHELRTPLNAIIGFTGTLLMRLPGPLTNEQDQQLRIVQSSARHLLSLINDILDLAKIESGKVEIHVEPVLLQDVLGEVAETLRASAEDKGLTFAMSLPDNPTVVQTDRRAFRQILLNLANNAVKYTEAGSVRVEATTTNAGSRRELRVGVIDTGIGIKVEDQPRLFQAFEQLDPLKTRRAEGAGLGLYLSHKLTLLLGGALHFSSDYGSGSTFTLTLPLER